MKKLILFIMAGVSMLSMSSLASASVCDSGFTPSFNISSANGTASGTANFLGNGTYSLNYNINGTDYSGTFSLTCPIVSASQASLSVSSFSVPSNQIGYKLFSLTYNGSVPINLVISSTNSFLLSPTTSSFVVEPNSVNPVPFVYNTTALLGTADVNITVNGTVYPVSITAFDSVAPSFKSITIQDNSVAGVDVPITVQVDDNINVTNVTYQVNSEDILPLTFQSGDTWTSNVKIFEIGDQSVTIKAMDSSNNTISVSRRVSITQTGGIDYFTYEPIQLAAGYTYRAKIFTSANQIPVNITLVNLNVNPNNTGFVISADGQTFPLSTLEPNATVNIKNFKGDLFLSMQYDNITVYTGGVKIDVPDWVGDSKTVPFAGQVGTLTILAEQNVTIGSKTLSCKFQNTGFIDTSKYLCSYEVGPLDLKNLFVLETQNEADSNRAAANSQANVFQIQLSITQEQLYVTIGIAGAMGAFLFFLWLFKLSGRRVRVGLGGGGNPK